MCPRLDAIHGVDCPQTRKPKIREGTKRYALSPARGLYDVCVSVENRRECTVFHAYIRASDFSPLARTASHHGTRSRLGACGRVTIVVAIVET